jgi:hypothetical protein
MEEMGQTTKQEREFGEFFSEIGLGTLPKSFEDVGTDIRNIPDTFKSQLISLVAADGPAILNHAVYLASLYALDNEDKFVAADADPELGQRWLKISKSTRSQTGHSKGTGIFKGLTGSGEKVFFQQENIKKSAEFLIRSKVFKYLMTKNVVVENAYSHSLVTNLEESLLKSYSVGEYKDSKPTKRWKAENLEWVNHYRFFMSLLTLEIKLTVPVKDHSIIAGSFSSWNLIGALHFFEEDIQSELKYYNWEFTKYYRKKVYWANMRLSEILTIIKNCLKDFAKVQKSVDILTPMDVEEIKKIRETAREFGSKLEANKLIHVVQVLPLWYWMLSYEWKINSSVKKYEEICLDLGFYDVNEKGKSIQKVAKNEVTIWSVDRLKEETKEMNNSLRVWRSKIGYTKKGWDTERENYSGRVATVNDTANRFVVKKEPKQKK